MEDKNGRREFLRRAAFAALTFPAIFQHGSKTGHAMNGSSADVPRESNARKKRICVEEHWIPQTGQPPELSPSINPAEVPLTLPRLTNFELRLPLMDESGVTMQVLAPPGIGVQVIRDRNTAVGAAKKANDAQAEIVRKYGGRFAGYATIPTQDPKVAADELERAVTQLGLKGAMVFGHTNGEYLDEQKFWPIWERAEGLEVPIYLHPFEPPPEIRKAYEGHPELMGPTWSWVVDTATHALRVIGAGVFDSFPKSTLILGHLGESLPYLLGRFDEGYAMVFKIKRLKKSFSTYIKENIVITTSGKYNPEALVCAITAMGIDRVLFAADYPFVAPKESVQLIESTQISDLEKEKIYHLNAERWLKL
jgi:2,3-dihydroxybenzoate decarboxylase